MPFCEAHRIFQPATVQKSSQRTPKCPPGEPGLQSSPGMSPTAVAASSPLTEAFAKRRNAGSPKPKNHSEIEMERMSGPDTILALASLPRGNLTLFNKPRP
ncbi:hypothetical protein DIPPA_02300 [Diplonema papillatum]|nr:hypothetical protein DIPPA_02300 [Diplonema papillatum]